MAPRRRPAAAKAAPRRARGLRPKAVPKRKAKARPTPNNRRKGEEHHPPRKDTPWKLVQDFAFQVGHQVHLKGKYKGDAAECVGEVESLVEDQEGQWIKLDLTGTPHVGLQEWRKSCQDAFYANRAPLLKSLDAGVDGLFCAREVREVDPLLEWKSNLTELRRDLEALPGLEAVARDLGYGVTGGVGNLLPPPPAQREEGESAKKPRKLRGKERVRQMVQQSTWSWAGSSLDPKFKRPKVGLKRKREQSSSSSSVSHSGSGERSEQEDLFPEESQTKHIARKCPGLLSRFAIKEAKKRLLTQVGEEAGNHAPSPVFVRYYRQVFAHSGASTPMKREYLTLATCLDSIIEGNILKCLDVGVQRLKAVEQMSLGAAAQLANRLELIPPETSVLASLEESRGAAQEHRREEKIRGSWKGKGKWESNWNRQVLEEQAFKWEKGSKSAKGKDPKGKPGGKGRPWKGQPAPASEVIPVKE